MVLQRRPLIFLSFYSIFLSIVGTSFGGDKKDMPQLDESAVQTGYECIILFGDIELSRLRSFACTSKRIHTYIADKLLARKIALPQKIGKLDYKTMCGYSTDGFRAAYIENYRKHDYKMGKREHEQNAFFVYLNHCNTALKVDTYPLPETFYEVPRKIPLFFIADTAWTYVEYTRNHDLCGLLMGVNDAGKVLHAKLFVQCHKAFAPSGWIADFLPKLHTVLVQQGTKKYYEWGSACSNDKSMNTVLEKNVQRFRLNAQGVQDTDGVVVIDLESLDCIAHNDAWIARCFMPQELLRSKAAIRNFDDDDPDITVFFNQYVLDATAINFLEKNKAFVAKDWSDYRALKDGLKRLALTRYKFVNNVTTNLV